MKVGHGMEKKHREQQMEVEIKKKQTK